MGDSISIYQNQQDKACFQHVMACGDLKDLPTILGKIFGTK